MIRPPPPNTVLLAVEERPDGTLVVHSPNKVKEASSPAELWGAVYTLLRDPSMPPVTTHPQTWQEHLGTMAADMVSDLVRKAAPTVVPAVHRAASRAKERAVDVVRTIQRDDRPIRGMP